MKPDQRARSGAGTLGRRIAARLRSWSLDGGRVAVGLSGGMDSVVLLDLLAGVRSELALELSAVHVHHGLSPDADRWTERCECLASELDVPLAVHRVTIRRNDPRGIEAAARAERYRCYGETRVDAVALAHHADDQAETVLLQLLRGAGPQGLAAMPEVRFLSGGVRLVRPILDVPRAVLLRHALDRGLQWVDDESNQDERYARNFLRHSVVPVIAQRYPAWDIALARAAVNAAEAAGLLDRLAGMDLQRCATGADLHLEPLRMLDASSQANVLRFWLKRSGAPVPSRARLGDMVSQLISSTSSAELRVPLGNCAIVRRHGVISVRPDDGEACRSDWSVRWHGESAITLPDGRVLLVERTLGTGPGERLLRDAGVTIRNRRGGERMRVATNRPRRTLKNLLQESDVAVWERRRLPLVFAGETLVHVPGVATAPEVAASPDEAGLSFRILHHGQSRE
ncbi:MAG: tRNA lysidine(34) synthetase TilS [Betaproteobacteria bacterium]|nr:tRNA lysidine(34) synthetase TilS [Betaproteobacteria bacterium]